MIKGGRERRKNKKDRKKWMKKERGKIETRGRGQRGAERTGRR